VLHTTSNITHNATISITTPTPIIQMPKPIFVQSGLIASVQNLKGISLKDTQKASLMSRTDTKFVFHQDVLEEILNELQDHYYCLDISGDRVIDYETLYFDTKNFDFYNQHHNGKATRCKVRARRYVNNNLSFLEVKLKNNKAQTNKTRIPTTILSPQITEEGYKLIRKNAGLDATMLRPQLWIYYQRISLVRKDFSERLTIDLGLRAEYNGRSAYFNNIVIAEVKRSGNAHSPFIDIMRKERFKQTSISKYCVCTAAINPTVKHNKFKKKLLLLDKIKNESYRNI
jgi:hypothetical protein